MMVSTPCTIKHIELETITLGKRYLGAVDGLGGELSTIDLTETTKAPQRLYKCLNCKKTFDGSESFDETKAHLGSFPVFELGPERDPVELVKQIFPGAKELKIVDDEDVEQTPKSTIPLF